MWSIASRPAYWEIFRPTFRLELLPKTDHWNKLNSRHEFKKKPRLYQNRIYVFDIRKSNSFLFVILRCIWHLYIVGIVFILYTEAALLQYVYEYSNLYSRLHQKFFHFEFLYDHWSLCLWMQRLSSDSPWCF